ncbi:DUF4386 domain-containing protein [Paenibacillus sp. SYP-B3998]|uniref:DUF4386 domain-containing protein n=1 Tax=Paenibacillus sp. SYP-B3998 TaxID=2678564 RepID=A0A6G4A4C8_9BACL|nr:DUF4386 domain-containing protein [Paenibacillus sp. SYP-B3998]NEW09323.1 DUF4386 domain-containing protein [Paenibacillus sp. SYP-B3998]
MNTHKKTAIIVGVLFILATVSSIIGLILYDPILNDPDYLIKGSEHANKVILGAVFELILVCSAIGTSITLFPLLRKQNESLALGYVCFRFLEAVIITVGIISVLSLLTLSQEFVKAGAPNAASFQTSGTLLKAIHDWTFLLGPNFMLGVNTMLGSYLLYKSKLVPRVISGWGLTGATLILIAALLVMFGVIRQLSTWGAVLAIPVASYEMILAVWLIVKGFNLSALSSKSAKMQTTS